MHTDTHIRGKYAFRKLCLPVNLETVVSLHADVKANARKLHLPKKKIKFISFETYAKGL